MTKKHRMNIRRCKFFDALNEFIKKQTGNSISYEDRDRLLRYLVTQEHRLNYISELECSDFDYYNRCIDEDGNYENKDREKLERAIFAYLKKICNKYDFKKNETLYFNHDPRGLQLRFRIKIPENNYFYNSWDGETSGVDWCD